MCTNRESIWLRHAAFNDFGLDLGDLKFESYIFPVENIFVDLCLDKPGVRVFIRLRCRIFLSVFFDFRFNSFHMSYRASVRQFNKFEWKEWSRVNRAKWDELAVLHLAATAYDLTALRTGHGRLHPIEEAELGPVQGLRILHLHWRSL